MWKNLKENHGYKLIKKIGCGQFGEVYKAKCITTGEKYAIKLMKNPFKTQHVARQVYREIKLMRKLSEIETNLFTSKLVDIILPGCSFKSSEPS